jgi:hypothetical protein
MENIMADRKLTDIFVVPPISILDVKQKYWKDRRKYWLSLNIQSELGRNANLLNLSDLLMKKQKSTSVFDPVLCEIMMVENQLLIPRVQSSKNENGEIISNSLENMFPFLPDDEMKNIRT